MKYHKQLIKHDPENGQYGDCYRTVIACLLDLEPEQVPHICENGSIDTDGELKNEMNQWLADNYGLSHIEFPIKGENLQQVLDWTAAYMNSCRYTLLGKSAIGVNHIVIANGSRIEHCTSGNGIVGPIEGDDGEAYYWIGFLVKIS